MGLYMLDMDANKAAQYHCDFDLAPAMMSAVGTLSRAIHEAGLLPADHNRDDITEFYAKMTDDRLWSTWARGRPENVQWLSDFVDQAKKEVQRRFHYTPRVSDAVTCLTAVEHKRDIAIPQDTMAGHPDIMDFGPRFIVDRQVPEELKRAYPDEVKTDEDFIDLARFSYGEWKAELATWTNREAPDFIVPF